MNIDDFLKPKQVRCVIGSSSSLGCLTAGKLYEVIGAAYGRLKIHNDNSGFSWYDMNCFELVIESAENPPQGTKPTPTFEAVEPVLANNSVNIQDIGTNILDTNADIKDKPEFEAFPDAVKPGQTPITSFSFIDVLKKSASSIRTQDNLGTANPAYCVKERTRHFGIDDNYQYDDYEWFCSEQQEGIDCNDDMYDAFNTIAAYTGENEVNMNGDTYQKCYYLDGESTVTICFTREQAQRYIDENRHNLKNPFIYVESFNRNPEMIAMRELLICLAENPTMFDGIMVTEGQLDE